LSKSFKIFPVIYSNSNKTFNKMLEKLDLAFRLLDEVMILPLTNSLVLLAYN